MTEPRTTPPAPRISNERLDQLVRYAWVTIPSEKDWERYQVAKDLLAERTARSEAQREFKRLRAHLKNIVELIRHPGETQSMAFERVAEDFYRDTGVMAPGKSVPLEMGGQNSDPDERGRLFDAWFRARITDARAALGEQEIDCGVDDALGEQEAP